MLLDAYKQPQGFSIFFLTEMWERYGFYVIQTLLVFFLLKRLHLNDSTAYITVGSFTALAYINSIFGGVIADKLIGMGKAILLGGVLLTLGYALLSIAYNMLTVNFGLAAVTVGTGLLKPNISSLLGVLYPSTGGVNLKQDESNESLKVSGYTMYVVGIYVGALSGSFIGGYLQAYCGFFGAYLSATIGGLLAVVTFLFGQWKFNLVDQRRLLPSFLQYVITILSVIGIIGVSFLVLHSEFLATLYFALFGIFCLGYIIYCIMTHYKTERRKLIVFLLLMLLSVCYWGIYFQQFFSISLCMARACELDIPASVVPSIESFGVILFGFIINYIWYYLQQKNKNLSISARFSLGFLFNSLCFLLLFLGLMYYSHMGSKLASWVIVVAYFLVAIGEVCIYPTMLAMVTSLVPERLTSAMMGVSMLSIGFGGKLAGLFANQSAIDDAATTLLTSQRIYIHAFFNYFVFSLVMFVISVGLIKQARKLAEI